VSVISPPINQKIGFPLSSPSMSKTVFRFKFRTAYRVGCFQEGVILPMMDMKKSPITYDVDT
jgi:hypothetical protein